uniref:Uncharacterized protein n=1 Tax=Glossina pallidipes TaxID=7398 RepID=A0A1A9ZNS4_GLOPL
MRSNRLQQFKSREAYNLFSDAIIPSSIRPFSTAATCRTIRKPTKATTQDPGVPMINARVHYLNPLTTPMMRDLTYPYNEVLIGSLTHLEALSNGHPNDLRNLNIHTKPLSCPSLWKRDETSSQVASEQGRDS